MIKIPAKYKDRVENVFKDEDGYWIYLNPGWYWDDPGLHIIHEDTQKEALFCLRCTQVCNCDWCKEKRINK